jgi:hypothetical protein
VTPLTCWLRIRVGRLSCRHLRAPHIRNRLASDHIWELYHGSLPPKIPRRPHAGMVCPLRLLRRVETIEVGRLTNGECGTGIAPVVPGEQGGSLSTGTPVERRLGPTHGLPHQASFPGTSAPTRFRVSLRFRGTAGCQTADVELWAMDGSIGDARVAVGHQGSPPRECWNRGWGSAPTWHESTGHALAGSWDRTTWFIGSRQPWRW